MGCPEGTEITGSFCSSHPFVSIKEREQKGDWINMFFKKKEIKISKFPPKQYFQATFCFSFITAVLVFILHYPWPQLKNRKELSKCENEAKLYSRAWGGGGGGSGGPRIFLY